MAANNILSDQRLLAFHYLAALFNLLRGAELRCDQRLLAFHYLAGIWQQILRA